MRRIVLKLGLLGFGSVLLAVSACQDQGQKEKEKPQTTEQQPGVYLGHLMAGELRAESVILQARLTATDSLHPEKLEKPGENGWVRFAIWPEGQQDARRQTGWKAAQSESDHIAKVQLRDLRPNTAYRYRAEYGADTSATRQSREQHFTTLAGPGKKEPVVFAFSSCMHYERFMCGGQGDSVPPWKTKASPEDSAKGYPGLVQVAQVAPRFWFSVGDNVYYDHTCWGEERAKDLPAMRKKWHRIWAFPRMQELLSQTAVYWLKDDHDHRFDDSDTTEPSKHGFYKPSNQKGIYAFREAVPVVPPSKPEATTYRTVRVNQDLQVWMLENRDYRSPNKMPDGPEKSIWGDKQKQWLKETLKASDANYKMIVSPNPMVGPDDTTKRDNHTNRRGFRHEGEAFFDWLQANDFDPQQTFIVCGDRHWQYHSIHPSGFQEFGSGALTRQNSRYGREPGDPASTDPKGKIEQPYIQKPPTGAFIRLEQGRKKGKPYLKLRWISQAGKTLYRYQL